MWEAHNWSKFRKQKVEVEEEKKLERDRSPRPNPHFPAMMNVLMREIIYSWSSLVLRDLWGQPVQLLQFTNEKAETREVRWLAMLAQAPPGKAGPENLVFWFQGSFYWASLILSSLLAKWLSLLSLPHSPMQSDWGRKLIVSAGLLPHGLLQKEPLWLKPHVHLWVCCPFFACLLPSLFELIAHAEVVLCVFPNTQYSMASVVLLFFLLDTASRILVSNMFLFSDPKVVRCVNSGKCMT